MRRLNEICGNLSINRSNYPIVANKPSVPTTIVSTNNVEEKK